MPTIKINNTEITISSTTTILQAAKQLAVDIPTMCYKEDLEPFTSCMICVVEDQKSGRLLPSCSALVHEGMDILTDSDKVRLARKEALELLLSEHVGDCEAPCQRGCPAHMNIPLMIRQIAAQDYESALKTIKADIALPAVLGRICPAPCEKVCNRNKLDEPVSICLLKRFPADNDLLKKIHFLPERRPLNNKKIAIIGSGPTGLSAAYYLLQYGFSCDIYDKNPLPGGMLRYGVDQSILPHNVLDYEIDIIQQLGAVFHLSTPIGKDVSIQELLSGHEAIVLAAGAIEPENVASFGVHYNAKGIIINSETFTTNSANIFAGGSAIRESRMAIRSCAHGKQIALSVNRYFKMPQVKDHPFNFASVIGKLDENDLIELKKQSKNDKRIESVNKNKSGYVDMEAVKEAERCMHCDCRKPSICKLRIYADEYQADQKHYKNINRHHITIIDHHSSVVYEPGKCIKCGLCVQITAKAGEKYGLSFTGRGFNVVVDVPFHLGLDAGLKETADECVNSCPTGAISFKHKEDHE